MGHSLLDRSKSIVVHDVRLLIYLIQLRDPADPNINSADFIPGTVIGDAGLGEVEDALEGTNSFCGSRAVNAVLDNGWNGRIVSGNTV